jgi:hypothetical protein
MTYTRFRRSAMALLAAAFVAACLAACGSSTSTSSSTSSAAASGSGASASSSRRSQLVTCLKAHGVTLPARPAGTRRPPSGSQAGGGSFFGGGGGGGAGAGGRFANNPKLQAAFQACGGGRGFGGRRVALNHAAVTKFVACVNQHGYKLPAPNFSGKGSIFPASISKNAKFQTAARACQADLRPAGAPAGGAPPSGGGTGTSTS